MTMTANGLAKLVEECGELTQIAAKKMARPDSDEHWDGNGSLMLRMEEEAADVMAAIQFVTDTHGLDKRRIMQRYQAKLKLFRAWHADPDN